jgi:hypothetical protein
MMTPNFGRPAATDSKREALANHPACGRAMSAIARDWENCAKSFN